MAANNFFELVCSGLENGDQIGGPTELARILCDSIHACGTFDKHDLTKRYLRWWKTDAFDTGPTFASVFNVIEIIYFFFIKRFFNSSWFIIRNF